MKIMLIVFLSLTVPVIANEYECGNPTASYSCNKEGCERTFPDIDSIPIGANLDTKKSELEVCLFTACYKGKAKIFPDPLGVDKQLLTFSLVKPIDQEIHSQLISFNVDKDYNYSLIYSFAGSNLVFAFGKCVLK